MGKATVDEAIRNLVCSGTNPNKIALLDNFCLGDPNDPAELGSLVETAKGMAKSAKKFQAPFISGKDSFYNFYKTKKGKKITIPTTLLISAIGVVKKHKFITTAQIRRADSTLWLLGEVGEELGGSQIIKFCQQNKILSAFNQSEKIACKTPIFSPKQNFRNYKRFYKLLKTGAVLSAHDVSEGGLLTTLAEMTFSEIAGCEIAISGFSLANLFAETPGCIIFELAKGRENDLQKIFGNSKKEKRKNKIPVKLIGMTTPQHKKIILHRNHKKSGTIEFDIAKLKQKWQSGLKPYF